MTRVEAAERIARTVYDRWAKAPARSTVLPALLAVARHAAGLNERPEPPRTRGLTASQLDVLRLVAVGKSHAQIAAQLGITGDAVKSRLYEARRRLGANNRVHAVVVAVQAGLVTIGEEW